MERVVGYTSNYRRRLPAMMQPAQRAVAWLMNRIRINDVHECMHDGATAFVKRRRIGAPILIWLANQLLTRAHSGIRMIVRTDEWMDWEIHCSHLLYPDRPGVRRGPGPAVTIPKVFGISLNKLLQHDDADVLKGFILAARELRRVHQLPCSHYDGAWSHGDLHLENIVCDLNAEHAVLIDFDIRHDFQIRQTQRQGDDLKVVLLDLLGRADNKWIPLATAFVQEYRETAVLAELSAQLFVPRGISRLLWYARTNCAPLHRIEPRLHILREIIHRLCRNET